MQKPTHGKCVYPAATANNSIITKKLIINRHLEIACIDRPSDTSEGTNAKRYELKTHPA